MSPSLSFAEREPARPNPNSTSGQPHPPVGGYDANNEGAGKLPLRCRHSRCSKPIVVWLHNGSICFGGNNVRMNLSTREITGQCARCNGVWRWSL